MDSDDFLPDEDDKDQGNPQPTDHTSMGDLAGGIPGRVERREADERQGKISKDMWMDYRRELCERGMI
jgi:hypothetical protein